MKTALLIIGGIVGIVILAAIAVVVLLVAVVKAERDYGDKTTEG